MTFYRKEESPIFLRIDSIVPKDGAGGFLLGHFEARAAPGDDRINVVEHGQTREEALERLVNEIDKACFALSEARRLAIELLQEGS